MAVAGTFSALMFVAFAISACLALFAFVIPPQRTRATKTFVMLNASAAAWALGGFLRSAAGLPAPLNAAPIGSTGWWIASLNLFGVAVVPVAWFLFAASHTRRLGSTRGAPLAIAAAWGVTVSAVWLTNPLHGLMSAPSPGTAGPGALVAPVAVVGMSAIVWSVAVIAKHYWGRGDVSHRVAAVALATSGALPILGVVLFVTQGITGLRIPQDPAPMLAVPMQTVLAIELFRSGIADVLPVAAAQAFQAMSDIALVTDASLVILTVNEAAARELPSAKPGARLEDVLPEATRHAAECVRSDAGYLPFELERDGNIYWGRVHCTRRRGRVMGTVVLLSDITDLRYAQEELRKATRRPGVHSP